MNRSAALILAALVAAAAPAPAAANPHIETCLAARASAQTLADACRRAIDWGGLSARRTAAAWTNVGVALAELGRDGDALSAYDRAVAADPGFDAVHANRALSLQRRGRDAEALESWSEAIRRTPRDWSARLGRGSLLLRMGRASEALSDLDAAAGIAPREPDVHFNRGLALAELGREAEARRAFDRTLALDPDDAAAYLQRGLTLADDDALAALADLDQAVRLAPEWAAAWATRGQLNERAGRPEAAALDYRRAFDLGFQATWLNERIEALGR